MIGSLAIDAYAGFTVDFEKLLAEAIKGGSAHSESQYLHQVYRPWDLPVMVHVNHEKYGTHKLQFLDTPRFTLLQLIDAAKPIMKGDPCKARVMRVDCTADLLGIPVEVIKRRMRVKFKRSGKEIGYTVKFQNRVESLYYGSDDNHILAYDKVAERLACYRKRCGKKLTSLVPSFEKLYGFQTDAVITRLERKYGARYVPTELATLEVLVANAMIYNPFDYLQFSPPLDPLPDPKEGWDAYIKAVGWRSVVDTYGFAEAYKKLAKYSGNPKRFLSHIEESLPPQDESAQLSPELILETYRTSLAKQMAGL